MSKLINKEEFSNLVENANDSLVVVDFFASWCGPCRMISPILEEVCEENNVTMYKVDTDEEGELAQKNGVLALPTVILFKNGKEVDKFVGFKPKEEIEEIINKNK